MEYQTMEQWPFEQASAEQEKYANDLPSYRGPIFRWFAFRRLEQIEAEYRKGNNGFSLLAAVQECAKHDIVMPAWLAVAYISRYHSVLSCRVGSWDQAFDPPYKKGSHLNAMRKKRSMRLMVHREVVRLRSTVPGVAIDKALFEMVGEKLGLGQRLTEEYYYSAQRLLIGVGGPHLRKRRQR